MFKVIIDLVGLSRLLLFTLPCPCSLFLIFVFHTFSDFCGWILCDSVLFPFLTCRTLFWPFYWIDVESAVHTHNWSRCTAAADTRSTGSPSIYDPSSSLPLCAYNHIHCWCYWKDLLLVRWVKSRKNTRSFYHLFAFHVDLSLYHFPFLWRTCTIFAKQIYWQQFPLFLSESTYLWRIIL